MDKEILDVLKVIQNEITSMKSEMTSMKSEMTSMKSEMTSMKSEMTSMKSEMTSMSGDITSIKGTLCEHTQLLRALEHKTDVISAETENIKHDIAEVHGEVKAMRKDLSQVEIVTANNWADIARLKAVK